MRVSPSGSTLSFGVLVGVLVLPSSAQSPTIQVHPLRNGDFERSVDATYTCPTTPPPGLACPPPPVYGSFWNNAEDKIVDTSPDAHGRVLELSNEGDVVTQRFAGFEFLTDEPELRQGGTLTTQIHGWYYTSDPSNVTDLVLEESGVDMDGGLWDFYEHPPITSGLPGTDCTGTYPTGFPGDFKYWKLASSTNVNMTATVDAGHPELGTWSSGTYTWIKMETQAAAKDETAIRAWKAPRSGRVLVEARVCRDRDAEPEPEYWDDFEITAAIRVYDDDCSRTVIATPVPDRPVEVGDGFTICMWIDVAEGNLIAFENTEHLHPTRSMAIRFDPTISYQPRSVRYRFTEGFLVNPYPPVEDCPPIGERVDDAEEWHEFSFDAGDDFENCFGTGPIPQLTLRLELVSAASHSDFVRFDDLEVETGMLDLDPEALETEVREEVDRILVNQMLYGCVETSPVYLHPYRRYDYDITNGATKHTTHNYALLSPLSNLAMSAAENYYHTYATPWTLNQVETIVNNRDTTNKVPKVYRFATGTYLPLASGTIGSLNLGAMIRHLLRAYDLTHDVRTLIAAHEMGEVILDEGVTTVSAASPIPAGTLYQTSFDFDYLDPDYVRKSEPSAAVFALKHVDRVDALSTLAVLHARTAAHPHAHSLFPRRQDFFDAAVDIAEWVHEYIDNVGGYGAYWMNIDNEFDDVFGFASSAAYAAELAASDAAFTDVLQQGLDELHPEWVQSTARGTRMAGDQQRGWNAWTHFFDAAPTTNHELGQAYLDGVLTYIQHGQLWNGVWSACNVSHFQHPDLSGLGLTPLGGADGSRFASLVRAYSSSTLASESIVDSQLRTELRAYFASMFRMNTMYYGHSYSGQVGYLPEAIYPDLPGSAPAVAASAEFRVLGDAVDMVRAMEVDQGIDRPTALVEPADLDYDTAGTMTTQEFTITDADGLGDIAAATVRVTKFSGNTVVDDDTYAVSTAYFDLAPSTGTVVATWKSGYEPDLESGYSYRFELTVIDSTDRWARDCAYYIVP